MSTVSVLDKDIHIRRAEPAVTVVGAGPAGLACAIALARGGRRVVVREAHDDVGGRFHEDFQGIENWSDEQDVLDELRAGGIDTVFEVRAVSQGILFDPSGERHTVKGGRPLYYAVRRGAGAGMLDRGLLQQALDCGVEVRFGDRAHEIEAQAQGVFAAGPRSADAIAVGYVFETPMADGAWLALGNELAPLGYAYFLVQGGRGTVASCMFTGFKRQAEYVERTVAFFRENAGLTIRGARPFGGFANFRLARVAVQGGHLVVGEQAGFQDALAGFGLRYALRSGLLAARSILEEDNYTSLWRKELLPLLRVGVVNRFVFNTIGEPGWRLAVRRLSRGDAGITLRRFYRPSFLAHLLFPLARWRYRLPLRDPSCDHVDCTCVWCHCQADSPELSASVSG